MPLHRILSQGKGMFLSFLALFFLFGVASLVSADVSYDWTRTVGGTIDTTAAVSTATDSSGSVYVTGTFKGTVDFDPGIGVDNYTSDSQKDIFLTKFDANGTYQWTRTWGSASYDDYSTSVTTDSSGNSYVVGVFLGDTDFDGGSGTDNRSPMGYSDMFLVKYDSSGNYQWVKTWGGLDYLNEVATAVTSQGSDIYITGYFSSNVNFNPDGWDMHSHLGSSGSDVFVTSYTAAGDYQWTETWGGTDANIKGMAVNADANGNIYIGGNFSYGTVDFDSGSGTDAKTSTGSNAFLVKYDTIGNYQWVKVWGGGTGDLVSSIATDTSGNVYVGGYFFGTTDFDPGIGTDERTAPGLESDAYVSRYDSLGNYQWVKSWGGDNGFASNDRVDSIAVDHHGNVYLGGEFYGTVDFDPGVGTDNHTSAGNSDAFLSKYDSMGNYQWTQTWGNASSETAYVATDFINDVYVSGHFSGTVDFDPTSGVDEQSDAGHGAYFLSKYQSGEISSVPTSLSPSNLTDGSTTSGTAPTFTFTLPDPGDGSVGYRIQVSTSSDFSSLVLDYTSAQGTPGSTSFTVGQTEAGGSYAVGNSGQTLTDGSYYWRVSSIDSSSQQSDWATANNGLVAFILSASGGSNTTVSTPFLTNLDINSTISLNCPNSVTLNPIVGTGYSIIDASNEADCTVITNNANGYKMEWQASTADLVNQTNDHFTAYTPNTSGIPETWSITNTVSAWGAKLASSSEGYNAGAGGNGYTYPGTGWGSNDSYATGKFLNVDTSPFQFMSKSTETDVDGETQGIVFGAEVGTDKLQPTGNYTTDVTVTATTL